MNISITIATTWSPVSCICWTFFFSLNMNSMYLYVPLKKNQFHRVYEFNKWVIIILILSIIIIYKFYHF